VTTANSNPAVGIVPPLSWHMTRVSSQRCLVQQNRGVVQHIGRRGAAGQRNEPHTTSLVERDRVVSHGPTHASMGMSTYLLASVGSVASVQEMNRTRSTEVRSGWKHCARRPA
jgi:hypothetical protein